MKIQSLLKSAGKKNAGGLSNNDLLRIIVSQNYAMMKPDEIERFKEFYNNMKAGKK